MVTNALQSHLPGMAGTRVGAANSSRVVSLGSEGIQPTAAEQQRVSDLQEQFQQQAQKDPAGFRLALRAAFGDKASLAQIDQLLDLALSGDLPMPQSILFVEAGSLGRGALGAYDANNGGSLYLDRSLLSDPSLLQSVFKEEMGHHLDALLGGADAAGDEGAVFSRTLESGTLSQQELTALKSEYDHGYIDVNGKQVAVEFRNEDEGSGNGQGGADTGGSSGGGGADSGGGTDAGGGTDTGGSGGGGADSGGGTDASGGTDTGGSRGGGGADSGGGTDIGGGTESGAGECSAHDPSGVNTGPEESVDAPEEPAGPPGGRQSDNRDDEKGNTEGKQETNSTGGPPGSDQTPEGDTPPRDETSEGDKPSSNQTTEGDKPPSDEETESAINAAGYAGTGIGFLDTLNQWGREAARRAGRVADDIVDMSRRVSGWARGAGNVLTVADPAIAAMHEGQRAKSEGADLGEQIDLGLRAGAKRLDNVGMTIGVGAAAGAFNPLASVPVGAAAGFAYGNSAADAAFDSAVDAVADELQSPGINAEGYSDPRGHPGRVNEGWRSLNRMR